MALKTLRKAWAAKRAQAHTDYKLKLINRTSIIKLQSQCQSGIYNQT